MKGISFIIILSIVWSVISGIIEKQKKAAKLKQESVDVSTTSTSRKAERTPDIKPWQPTQEQVKVERLRRKQRASVTTKIAPVQKRQPTVTTRKPVLEKPAPVAITTGKQVSSIKELHKEACDLKPVSKQVRKKAAPAWQIARLLKNRRNVRTAICVNGSVVSSTSTKMIKSGLKWL